MTEEEKELKKKEALNNYNLANKELKKERFKFLKRLFICLGLFLIVTIIIRLCFGRLYFSLPYMYYNKSIEYNLFVNGEHENIDFEDCEDTPIIPGLLYYRRVNMGGWLNMDKYDEPLYFQDEKIILDFEVNECYTHTDKVRVNCDSTNDKLIRKKVKPIFTRIFIRKNGKNEQVKYDGKYISDISEYVKEKGYYYIEIYAEYDGVKTKLVIFPKRDVSIK